MPARAVDVIDRVMKKKWTAKNWADRVE